MRTRKLRVAVTLAALATIAAIISWAWSQFSATPVSVPPKADAESAGAPGGPFSLVDHTGKPVSNLDYRGKFILVFFGYTYCPDVCPTTLQDIADAMEILGRKAARIHPLFVSVDPDRDTPEVLADYVSAFGAGIVGLTGTSDQVKRAAKAYRVYYANANAGGHGHGDASEYLVDHSAFTYLMGPDGKYLTHFAHGASPEAMAKEIRRYIDDRT